MRSKLTDHYYDELQELKSRHALEVEQLKAKLSERHLQGVSQTHYDIQTIINFFLVSKANLNLEIKANIFLGRPYQSSTRSRTTD